MSVTYTTNMSLEKPTPGNSYNVWGTELNRTLDLIDTTILSNNFAENSASHSGLDFAYKNGRVLNGTTMTTVSGSTVTLTDNQTNYVEVTSAGSVSANTTAFTAGRIPLFTVVTVSGAISVVTDKRGYFTPSWEHLFSSDGTDTTTAENLIVGGTLECDAFETDANNNLLLNAATAETSSIGAFTLKQGTDPTTSTADQISLYATSGASCTLGLRTEASLSDNVLPVKLNGASRYLNFRKSGENPISAFMTSTVQVINTTTETEILSFTLDGLSDPSEQVIMLRLAEDLTTANASDLCTLRVYVGSDSYSFYNSTSGTHSAYNGWIDATILIKDTTNYAFVARCIIGGYSFSVSAASTQTFTSNVTIKVTAQFNNADPGTFIDCYGGCFLTFN